MGMIFVLFSYDFKLAIYLTIFLVVAHLVVWYMDNSNDPKGESVGEISDKDINDALEGSMTTEMNAEGSESTIVELSLIELRVLEVNQDVNLRCLKISMVNSNMLEDENLFKAIYNTIFNIEEFKDFGYEKIIILSVVLVSDKEHSLHSNILINNDTTFEQYYEQVQKELDRYNNLAHGYHNEQISRFVIKAWNVDNLRNKKIKQTYNIVTKEKGYILTDKNNSRTYSTYTHTPMGHKGYQSMINPLSIYNKKGQLKQKFIKPIFTMDIETIYLDVVKSEVPIAISSCGYYQDHIDNKIFLIDPKLLLKDHETALKQLWKEYFNYLDEVFRNEDSITSKLTIFAHNLGNFDGYFLYKALLNHYPIKNVNSLIDERNKFISITIDGFPHIEWKDSFRIFTMSLDKLCKMFGVEGKLSGYNPKFRNLDFFNDSILLNEFIEYSKQDALALFKAFRSAQNLYWNSFKVDPESIYSTSTLSLKIYRTHFQKHSIPILSSNIDSFVRNAYYGGGTDIYQAYGENVYYYDVNSLYPFGMLNPMPYQLLNNKPIDLSNKSLDSFFGFALAEIECPTNMLRPVLPFHKDGKTIYPVGNWTATYFSEELKAVEKLGYKIKLIKGLEFSKIDLFSDYVLHFSKVKELATIVGNKTEREMAKNQLNNLYGYFGRKHIGLLTQNVHNNDLIPLLLHRTIKSINPINSDYSTVLMYSNINHNLLKELKATLYSIGSDSNYVMSNVAIAAAVTSYARIYMIPYKIDPNTLYTDTDSIFTTKVLDDKLIGNKLGMMKDELKGNNINEAYFIGPKKYGYYIIDEKGVKTNYSVFSGVPRNTLTFDEIRNIYQGKAITKNINSRFYKSFTDLNIIIKDSKITIKNTNSKLLKNNIYYPPIVNTGYQSNFDTLLTKITNLIIKYLRKLRKYK